MALKKSELYSSLWKSCDELRGGMDASQYKDYVLVMLFVKYISDKYANQPFAPITVPKGASFKDMVALKGKPTIGDDINKKILGPISEANRIADFPDFNDVNKLGSGQEMVKRLSNLIAIFENPELNFSKNKADGDDLLGDAYEYLMRHFATESGKSKGQFYTPAEVSRVMAKIIGINSANTTSSTTVYDPTCGSGSLLLKVAEEADKSVSLYGQEMDVSTASLARMNMILHNNPTAEIRQGNTLANPLFLDSNGNLKTFDYVVANPPFSFKSWSNGVDPVNDPFGRFQHYGIPPEKNGDYAFLLHIVRSLKSTGKGAVILPHGVLFRGNAEAEIRRNLIRNGLIKGIIGLPPNLFYGTGIPACIIVLDKEEAANRKHIFMIDASKGFKKDGNKNRLREQDIHKIVDVFNKQLELDKYSLCIPIEEIEEKEYNLNIPRYIDSQEPEDIQDLEAHLKGGIPNHDIDALEAYWKVYPTLKNTLFEEERPGYSRLKIPANEIRTTIAHHPEFAVYNKKVASVFNKWKHLNIEACKNVNSKTKPKQLIFDLSESLLKAFSNANLLDNYDIYQHLMDYWAEVMQDDVYLIIAEGWGVGRSVEYLPKGKEFEGRLIPKQLIIEMYLSNESMFLGDLKSERDQVQFKLDELVQEHSAEDGYLAEFDGITKANVQQRLHELTANQQHQTKASLAIAAEPQATYVAGTLNHEEVEVLQEVLALEERRKSLNKEIKEAEVELFQSILRTYEDLREREIIQIVVETKWMKTIESAVEKELDNTSVKLSKRVTELVERYDTTLVELNQKVSLLEERVSHHLTNMGYAGGTKQYK